MEPKKQLQSVKRIRLRRVALMMFTSVEFAMISIWNLQKRKKTGFSVMVVLSGSISFVSE